MKKIIFIIVLIVLIISWAGAYKLKYEQWPWQRIKIETEKETEKETETEKEKTTTETAKETKISRQEIMKDVAGKISQISPSEPVLGGKWHALRFWFATNSDFYVEYEDGHIIRRILVKGEGSIEKPEYKIIGYFEPGENDWVLKQGQDTMFGKPLDLYEYDQIKKEWTKKN